MHLGCGARYTVGHGNSGWMIAHRNCYEEGQTKPEFCNYFSYIHFREVAITPAVEAPEPDGSCDEDDSYGYDAGSQAAYVKMDVYEPGAAVENFTVSAQVQVQGERRTQGRAAVLCPCMTWCREECARPPQTTPCGQRRRPEKSVIILCFGVDIFTHYVSDHCNTGASIRA